MPAWDVGLRFDTLLAQLADMPILQIGLMSEFDRFPPPNRLGLRYFGIELPYQASLNEVLTRVEEAGIPANQTEDGLLLYDPSQYGIFLTKKS